MLRNICIVVVIIIVVILLVHNWDQRKIIATEREFITGFWCASPVDCEQKGYRGAFLYVGQPADDTGTSRSYIVALKGGRGQINRPFDFDVSKAWTGCGSSNGRIAIDGEVHDVAIDLDYAKGRMIWRDSRGDPLFVWEKNVRVTNDLDWQE